jgi:hypothetical protein
MNRSGPEDRSSIESPKYHGVITSLTASVLINDLSYHQWNAVLFVATHNQGKAPVTAMARRAHGA